MQDTREKIPLKSPSFGDHAPIPERHGRDRGNHSPPLEWGYVPPEAVELVLVCDDPDAPRGLFTHWVMAKLPPDRRRLDEDEVPAGTAIGRNDFGDDGYDGPQPPVGSEAHRYFFHLYALDRPSELVDGAERDEVDNAIAGKVMAEGQLVGTFRR